MVLEQFVFHVEPLNNFGRILCQLEDDMFHLFETVGWSRQLLVVVSCTKSECTLFFHRPVWILKEVHTGENLVPVFSFCQSICHMSCSS